MEDEHVSLFLESQWLEVCFSDGTNLSYCLNIKNKLQPLGSRD